MSDDSPRPPQAATPLDEGGLLPRHLGLDPASLFEGGGGEAAGGSDNRLIQILPSSLAAPPMIDAARAVGDAEARARALIPLAFIWERLRTGDLPEEILDHLAWHLHIDGYEYAESKEEKLWLVQHFHDWHRYKGTVYGHALYWRVLLKREVLGHAPRYNSYCGASLTAAERAAWAAPHPEIRVYPFRNKGIGYGIFPKGGERVSVSPEGEYPVAIAHWTPGSGHCYPVISDAADRIGQQLWFYDPLSGNEKRLNTVQSIATRDLTVAMPGVAHGCFVGRFVAGHTCKHGAGDRIYHITLGQVGGGLATLSARPLVPMFGDFVEIGERNPAGTLAFLSNRWAHQKTEDGTQKTGTYPDRGGSTLSGYIAGKTPELSGWHKIFPRPSNAGDRIYKMLKLFDASRAPKGTKNARAFIGGFRLGRMPAHCGEIAIDSTGVAAAGMAFLGGCHIHHQVPAVSDAAARIARIVDVGRLAARASDKIALSITNHQVIDASTAIISGQKNSADYALNYIS